MSDDAQVMRFCAACFTLILVTLILLSMNTLFGTYPQVSVHHLLTAGAM